MPVVGKVFALAVRLLVLRVVRLKFLVNKKIIKTVLTVAGRMMHKEYFFNTPSGVASNSPL